MVLQQDLCASTGQLIAARGFELSFQWIERLRNYASEHPSRELGNESAVEHLKHRSAVESEEQ